MLHRKKGQNPSTSLQNDIKMPEIMIAVMGETGAGKSHFIQQIIGGSDVGVRHSLHSGQYSEFKQH